MQQHPAQYAKEARSLSVGADREPNLGTECRAFFMDATTIRQQPKDSLGT